MIGGSVAASRPSWFTPPHFAIWASRPLAGPGYLLYRGENPLPEMFTFSEHLTLNFAINNLIEIDSQRRKQLLEIIGAQFGVFFEKPVYRNARHRAFFRDLILCEAL